MAWTYYPQYSLLATVSNLASAPLTVSGTTIAISHLDKLVNGTIDAIDSATSLTVTGLASVGCQITGTWSGTLQFDGTIDNTNWQQIRAVQFGGTLVGGTTVNGLFFIQVGGLAAVRIIATAWASGTATVYLEGTAAANAVTLANSLPVGTNAIGTVSITDVEDGAGDSVGDDANDALRVNVVAGGAGDGSILDGSDTSLKASVLSGTGAYVNPLSVRLTDDAGAYVAPGAASNITVSNLASVPLTVSGTTIDITSLPPLGAATVSISDGTQITVLETFPAYRMLTTTTAPIAGSWSVTRTYTAAATNSILLPLSASTTAHHITDIVFSNAQTHGNFTVSVSPSDASVYHLIDRVYFRDYGGVVMNLSHPLVCNTNSAILLTSRSSTDHSIFISGYTI
jgi:hypothetical protein